MFVALLWTVLLFLPLLQWHLLLVINLHRSLMFECTNITRSLRELLMQSVRQAVF